MIKKIRNIVLIVLAVLILLTATAMTILYIYRNEVVGFFVKEANKYIETPVEVKSIELELWENFPMISFKLDQVKIYESAEITMDYLCKADKMLISFDIFNILFKNYEISTLKVTEASFNIGRGPNGEKNYEFIRYVEKDSIKRQREINLPKLQFLQKLFVLAQLRGSKSLHLDLTGKCCVCALSENVDRRFKKRSGRPHMAELHCYIGSGHRGCHATNRSCCKHFY